MRYLLSAGKSKRLSLHAPSAKKWGPRSSHSRKAFFFSEWRKVVPEDLWMRMPSAWSSGGMTISMVQIHLKMRELMPGVSENGRDAIDMLKSWRWFDSSIKASCLGSIPQHTFGGNSCTNGNVIYLPRSTPQQ